MLRCFFNLCGIKTTLLSIYIYFKRFVNIYTFGSLRWTFEYPCDSGDFFRILLLFCIVLPSDCWKRKLLNIPHDIEIQVFQYQNVQRSVFLLESSEGSGVDIIMVCWVLLQKSIPTLPESQHKRLQNMTHFSWEGYLAQMLESVVLAHVSNLMVSSFLPGV